MQPYHWINAVWSVTWCVSPIAHLLQCVIHSIHHLYLGNIYNGTAKMKRNFTEDLKTSPLKRLNDLYRGRSTWLLRFHSAWLHVKDEKSCLCVPICYHKFVGHCF